MKIKTQLLLPYLLLALLTSSLLSIAMETVNDDMKMIRPAKLNPDSVNRFFLPTWGSGTKVDENMKKAPSAPNPRGNRHPPSKP
ncbi:CLAVATA3/ESR (CLE)-related protein 46-like [Hibiscus syriacus]|uniref:CLAVATA3/ESR (CLE)-related protein 46-like n=1 Tax=Hibiscus syriacus TaxID=106335 RepID=UPI00192382CF|nr:CLAVATA3/ESR (CLE)-related protein 46-like [Hibiscus syriacus]